MKRWLTPKNIHRASIVVAVFGLLALLAVDVFGRVGGVVTLTAAGVVEAEVAAMAGAVVEAAMVARSCGYL